MMQVVVVVVEFQDASKCLPWWLRQHSVHQRSVAAAAVGTLLDLSTFCCEEENMYLKTQQHDDVIKYWQRKLPVAREPRVRWEWRQIVVSPLQMISKAASSFSKTPPPVMTTVDSVACSPWYLFACRLVYNISKTTLVMGVCFVSDELCLNSTPFSNKIWMRVISDKEEVRTIPKVPTLWYA